MYLIRKLCRGLNIVVKDYKSFVYHHQNVCVITIVNGRNEVRDLMFFLKRLRREFCTCFEEVDEVLS